MMKAGDVPALAMRVQQQREGARQPDDEGAVVRRLPIGHGGAEGAAEGVAVAPATEARRAVAGADGLAVMEEQALRAGGWSSEAVVGDMWPSAICGRGRICASTPKQRVQDVEAVVHGDAGERSDRVRVGQRRLGHEAQHTRIGATLRSG